MNVNTPVTSLMVGVYLAVTPIPGVRAAEFQVARSDANFPAKMRGLLDTQVTWTRLYIVSAIGGLPDTAFARARLLRCADDMGKAVEAYYGRADADTIARGLRRHLQLLAEFTDALRAGDTGAVERSRAAWRSHADSAVAELESTGLAAPDVRGLVDRYLQLTDREVVFRARADYPNDTANFGELQETSRQLADAISGAILRQARAGRPASSR